MSDSRAEAVAEAIRAHWDLPEASIIALRAAAEWDRAHGIVRVQLAELCTFCAREAS